MKTIIFKCFLRSAKILKKEKRLLGMLLRTQKVFLATLMKKRLKINVKTFFDKYISLLPFSLFVFLTDKCAYKVQIVKGCVAWQLRQASDSIWGCLKCVFKASEGLVLIY